MFKQKLAPAPRGFVRGFHMVQAEHALGNITNQRRKVTRFAEANDPFELFALRVDERSVRKGLASWKDEQGATTGLLCFSTGWDSTLMWSHYANGHRGVCFGFDLKRDFVIPVKYRKARIEIEFDETNVTLTPQLEAQLRCTKSNEWKYEQELRAFVPLSKAIKDDARKLYFWPFGPRMRLTQVILGHRCELNMDDVRSAVAASGSAATVFRARMAFRRFKITPNLKSLSGA